jgi:hypothetical protein
LSLAHLQLDVVLDLPFDATPKEGEEIGRKAGEALKESIQKTVEAQKARRIVKRELARRQIRDWICALNVPLGTLYGSPQDEQGKGVGGAPG